MKYNDFINLTEYQRVYDEVVSLGWDCDMSFSIRYLFLQHYSYPFDWIRLVNEDEKYIIGFRRRIEFICTYFKDFINEPDLYIAYDNHDDEKEKNLGVYDSFNGMCFLHDFPKGKTIAEAYPSVKEKYDRRIKRLMDLINSDKKVCFCCYASFEKIQKAEIVYATEIFYKIFPKSNVDFLILQNDLNIGDDVVYEELSEHVRRIVFGEDLSDNKVALKSGTFKLKQLLNTMIMPVDKKTNFNATELNSNYCNGDFISNPTPDYSGLLSYGPYILVPQGDHVVTVNYDLTENYDVFVDVVFDKGSNVLVKKTELPHSQKEFILDFHMSKLASDLEVRFFGVPRDSTDDTNKFKLFGIHID